MIRSTKRILTTHAGCLQRPPLVTQALLNAHGDPAAAGETLKSAVANVVRARVAAGTDCGMGARIHPELGWAKLKALSEGARIASSRLWGTVQ